MTDSLHFDNPNGVEFAVEPETRTVRGLAVPYGVVGSNGQGKYRFAKGTLSWGKVKFLANHDWTDVLGVAELEETDDGVMLTAKVARGSRGDDFLALAEMGAVDGLSIGLSEDAQFTSGKDGVQNAVRATIREVSGTAIPAFETASITSVAASAAPNGKEPVMGDENETVETATDAVDFSAITEAITTGFANLSNPQGSGPEVVSAGHTFEVTEPAPYRFDGVPGQHDLSGDLIAFGRDRDSEAGARVMAFLQSEFAPKFDVDTGNVATLNPSPNRPGMYVDDRKYSTPFYDALHSGAITDMTPFIVPKFNAAADLVDDHVEGTEPTAGSFSATSQTVTPSAVSGRVEITREVWDQGGNPQVSALIWNRMKYEYFKALEAKAVAVLTANAASITDISLTTAAADDDLVNELEAEIAALQFVAGGNTFNFAGTHVDLYKALAAAVDSTGRKLLPMYGPTNANGQSRSKFRSLDVAGVEFVPAWSAGATGTVSANSWLVDTDSVHIWNSAPQRLEFQYRVAYVDLAIWGYVASAVTDFAGVRQITYDPTA